MLSPLVAHAGTQVGYNSQSRKAAHLMLLSGQQYKVAKRFY